MSHAKSAQKSLKIYFYIKFFFILIVVQCFYLFYCYCNSCECANIWVRQHYLYQYLNQYLAALNMADVWGQNGLWHAKFFERESRLLLWHGDIEDSVKKSPHWKIENKTLYYKIHKVYYIYPAHEITSERPGRGWQWGKRGLADLDQSRVQLGMIFDLTLGSKLCLHNDCHICGWCLLLTWKLFWLFA